MPTKIPVVEKILHANESRSIEVRRRLDQGGIFGLNLMASPGAGKTSVIYETVRRLQPTLRIGYIDGDIATTIDAARIQELGLPVVQINTGGDCHLNASMIDAALSELPLHTLELLLVENVGNLVCPANFSLGVHLNVLIASVPEGDDKPHKYPAMYRGVDVLLLNKIDLLPYIPFNVDHFLHGVETLNPGVKVFQLSALHGTGMDAWTGWLAGQIKSARTG
jgi:hydrogenase nickel incorporation protein HypB